MAKAFVFPGQGSQAVGMGRQLSQAFVAARELFEEVDDALDRRLSRLMFEGPGETLTLTENAQPALMAVSLAVMRVIEREAGIKLQDVAERVAGHSLGEYSALAAARAFTVGDAARLLQRRGQAMQLAVPVGTGAMAALLGLDLATAQKVAVDAAEGEICGIANDNAPGQVVVSGHKAAVERAMKLAGERGGRRAIMLPVSAPFHCPLLKPAQDAMREALDKVPPAEPHVPLVSNVTALSVSDPDAIRRLLIEQVTAMVRWRECVLHMKSLGIELLVEVGAGKVLTGLTRRIDPDMKAMSVENPADIEALLKVL
ncbi:MAG: [acyl-carrier-protein] S-malonyltransferase [Alphaproteobacteria bacterium]|nr:[acyl-carrier-protein] S-malonyltransferase [Alphaproteobacteria bacterium]